MSDSSRRGFLKVAGVGLAAAGTATVLPGTANAATRTSAEGAALPKDAEPSMVAYVEDVHTGRIELMVEGEQYTVTDPELVARLSHAVHAAKSV